MEGNSMELNIQRFAEGGAEGSSSGNATVAQSQSGENNPVAGENKGAVNGSGNENTSSTAGGPPSPQVEGSVTLDSIFEKYPELKKEADKRTQKAVQGRVHQINKSMQSQNDIIDKLMVHHGVNSMEELSKKIDTSTKEEFAIQHGVSEELADEMLQLRVNNRRNTMMREQFEAQMKVERQMQIWQDEAVKVKEAYPDFDLGKELENNEFKRLISADERYRMPMKQIYEMFHHDELVAAAQKSAAEAYSKSMAQMQSRPSENGLGNQSAVNGQRDVSKLTKKERADLAKRAQRGETITF